MAYQLIDEEKNEIRVLQFEYPCCLETSPGPLRFLIKNISLNDFTEEYAFYKKGEDGIANQNWQDLFNRDLELRALMPDQIPSSSTTTSYQSSSASRFTWGDYEALSYTWKEDKSKFIFLNGIRKDISFDLEEALRALHCLPETQFGMKYWIDALCINQEDIDERNHQVKRMKMIYSTARSVVVWLGPETKEDGRCIRAMSATREHNPRTGRVEIPSYFDAKDFNALCAFIKKPYWGRLWIIQELAVNHNSTLFLCGLRRLNRGMVKTAAEYCQEMAKQSSKFPFNIESVASSTAVRVYRLVDMKSDLNEDIMLRKALILVREAIASNPKDKVYGILGLLPESVSSQIVPDYSSNTTTQEVFTSLTMAVIQATKCLEQIVYGVDLSDEWPSWVPDLQVPFPRSYVAHLQKCQASKAESAIFRFVKDETNNNFRLCAKGIGVDTIDGISALSPSDSARVHASHISSRYGANTANVIARTLVLDHPNTKKNGKYSAVMRIPSSIDNRNWSADRDTRSCFLENKDYQAFQEFRAINQDFPINGKPFNSYFSTKFVNYKRGLVVLNHLRKAIVSMERRRLITTTTGYIGLAPDSVREGDIVVVFLGCNFPVLIRPSWGSTYRVLGECYILGLMEGEVFKRQKKENLSYRDFVLT